MVRLLVAASCALLLSGCAILAAPRQIVAAPTRDWRAAATNNDRERLREWRSVFTSALRRARAGGHAEAIAREGRLLDPDAALGGPIPNGDYRCRVIKLGGQLLPYIAYPAFTCRIRPDGNIQSFAKVSGSQRPVGLIFPGDALRQVFLGTLVLGDEQRAMQYGQDPDRDLAAFVERIGPAQWRMVLPRPAYESSLDVIELLPAH